MKHKLVIALAGTVMALGVAGIAAISIYPPGAGAACCYFAAQEKDINQPGQKAFIQWDPERRVEAFTVQPRFEGNALDFGMVIPTPAQPKLDEMPRDFFKDLAIYTILLPTAQAISFEDFSGAIGVAFSAGEEGPAPVNDSAARKFGVKVLEAGVVGSLDYKVIVAEQASGLFDWLKENRYVYSGNEETLDFYIRKKWFFTVMKIDPKQMKKTAEGSYAGEVTPTRFTFASDACIYPLKITQVSVKESTDALFYVQSPEQMDLTGDMTWMPSYRIMWLTWMLGCSISDEQQQELNVRQAWLNEQTDKDAAFTTTKLEWARKLADSDLSVLEDPLRFWPQAGGAPVAEGDVLISTETLIQEAREFLKTAHPQDPGQVKSGLARIEKEYGSAKGDIVKLAHPEKSPIGSRYVYYPRRDAPEEDLKGLSRLKGHLQKGQWLTKFRRIVRKEEMTDDLVLVPVSKGQEQEYVRIMPTSPP
ncbi:MAG: DUF2330 domain-containing protein [Planctomycetota bacterium]